MRLKHLQYYLFNRFIAKTHILPTHLKKGEYHEMHDKVLHASFEALVDFVEVECASHYMAMAGIKQSSFFIKRNQSYGMKHLEWEMSLVDEYAVQAEKAAVAAELYLWWKSVRPSRPDAWEDADIGGYGQAEETEKEYIKEDQEQLCKLARLLTSLWL